MFKSIILLALVSVSLQNFCSVNGVKGECTLIGECKGTQIVSQCSTAGCGCCLTGANALMEDYQEFSFWGWLKNAWERFKADPWKYVNILFHVITEQSIRIAIPLSNEGKQVLKEITDILKTEKNPMVILKKVEEKMKKIDKYKLDILK